MKTLLNHLIRGETLSTEQATEAFELIMSGQATPAQVGALLALIQARGPTVDEIAGAASVMRAKVAAVEAPPGLTVIDTCGSGGTHSTMFNISTAAALVAAAAGRPRGVAVAKHGNRSVTSRTGSSQVLEALGVKLRVAPETLTRCLDEVGFCFCFAPAHHPAMKHAAPVRAELGFPTLFNMLGPLTNPAGARRQLTGVARPELTETIAEVLRRLGAVHAMVVHSAFRDSAGGMCELMTTGTTRVSHLRDGRIRTYEVDPADLGLPPAEPAALRVDGAEQSAAVIRGVIGGQRGPARDLVLLNAAAALVVADLAADLREGLGAAAEAVDAGAAEAGLRRLVEITQADPTPAT